MNSNIYHPESVDHKPVYVLVTPVKDEEKFIQTTITSVINQTLRPAEWVIVSDGSTDRTNEIVRQAALTHSWIRLLALTPREGRDFKSVVHAVEAGIRALTVSEYDYFGLLDSDLRFKPDYFSGVIAYFQASPKLGLAGGVVLDPDFAENPTPLQINEVPGASQLFRRSCFEQLGGLVAIPEGGWDALTCAKARMLGYETRVLPDLPIDHLKPRSASEGGALKRRLQWGTRDYAIGYSLSFEIAKCIGRLREPPIVIGALCRLLGYLTAMVRQHDRVLPRDLIDFMRRERRERVAQALRIAWNRNRLPGR